MKKIYFFLFFFLFFYIFSLEAYPFPFSSIEKKQNRRIETAKNKWLIAKKRYLQAKRKKQRAKRKIFDEEIKLIDLQLKTFEKHLENLKKDTKIYQSFLKKNVSSLFLKEREILMEMMKQSHMKIKAEKILEKILRLITHLSNEKQKMQENIF